MLRLGAAGALAASAGAVGATRTPAPAEGTSTAAPGLRLVAREETRYLNRLITVARYVDRSGPAVVRTYIDGVELHTMAHHKGGYVSSIAHYEARATHREAAELAVERLDGLRLLPPAHEH